jgi:LAO/AO transport system kinase
MPDFIADSFQPKPRKVLTADDYVSGILSGNRTILSRAITLIESSRTSDKALAETVVSMCMAHSGTSIRVGITGVPGVGKSTFIEAFGMYLISQNRRVAVLAIDPTSEKSKGSILGDKVRMEKLSLSEQAFIRPSPAAGSLGGVAPKTRETMLLCEAAGFDTIIIETVGVGQSETAVHALTDFFLLLMLAGAGDELQGIKRGIMEMADLIAITKADGDNLKKAHLARVEYEQALHLFPPNNNQWRPQSLATSALTGDGLAEIWHHILGFHSLTTANGSFHAERERQATYWLHQAIQTEVLAAFYQSPAVKENLTALEEAVRNGTLSPFAAARRLLANT